MKRNYPCSQIALLQTSLVILNSMEMLLSRFTEHFTLYNADYVIAQRQRVTDAFQMIGLNTQTDKKESTQTLTQIANTAIKAIDSIITTIGIAQKINPERATLIISNLALSRLISQKNKSAKQLLSGVLNTYINTLPEYKAELIEKGVGESKLTELENLATQYIETATSQTINKGQSVKLTVEQQQELNDLYAEIMDVCRLGKRIFKDEPEKLALFNFSAIADRYKSTRQKKTEPTTETSAV